MSQFNEDDLQIDEEAIRRRVNRRILRWGLLGLHFIIWMVGAGLLDMSLGKPTSEVLILIWFGLVGLHAGLVALSGMRDRMVQREIRRERQNASEERYQEKLKRDRLYRLSDDGELVEVEDEHQDTAQQHVQPR